VKPGGGLAVVLGGFVKVEGANELIPTEEKARWGAFGPGKRRGGQGGVERGAYSGQGRGGGGRSGPVEEHRRGREFGSRAGVESDFGAHQSEKKGRGSSMVRWTGGGGRSWGGAWGGNCGSLLAKGRCRGDISRQQIVKKERII